MADPEISRFPRKGRPYMPGSQTTPGPAGARINAPASFAFREVNNVGTRIPNAFAAQWLAYTLPTDASQLSSRATAHGSGTTWVVTPSSQWTFTTYPLPVSRRTHFRSSFGHAPARFDPNFSSDAHHHGSLPQQLGLVWDLLLKADPGWPAHLSRSFTNGSSPC